MIKHINDINAENVRQKLLYYLQDNPQTIRMLAKDIGLSFFTVDRLLNGQSKPDLRTLLVVMKYLRTKYAERDANIGNGTN